MALALPATASAAGLKVKLTAKPAAATTSKTATFKWTVSPSGRGTTYTCSLDGAKATSCKSPKTYKNLSNKKHTLVVNAKRGRLTGKLKFTWTVDRVAPTAPTLAGGTGSTWSAAVSSDVTASGSRDAGSGLRGFQSEISTDNGSTFTSRADGASRTVTAEGSTLVRFRAVDKVGNASAWVTSLVRLDRTAPAVPTVTGGSAAWSAAASTTISGASSDALSGLASTEWQSSVDGGASWSASTAGAATTVSAEGTTLVRFRATDAAGNASAFSTAGANATVRLDRTAPAVPTIAGPVGPIAGTHAVSGTASDALSGLANVGVTFTGATSGAICSLTSALAAWSCPWNTTVLAVGAYTVTSTATDSAGNISTDVRVISVAAASLVVEQSAGTTAVIEGGAADSYTVRLSTQPTADVVVDLGANAQVSASPVALTFTPANWNTAQTVTVTAVNDAIDETSPANSSIAHTTSTTDASYDPLSATVTASVTDDDEAGLVFVGAVDVVEGGATDTYTVKLASEPTASVSVALAGSQVGAAPTPLVFTSANWNTAQTVTVTAVDDAIDEAASHAGSVVHDVTSTDPFYSALVDASHPATVTDDDTAAVTVTQSLASTDVVEGGATDVYTVVLATEPTANVSIAVSDDAQVDASPAALTFTPANWNTAQTVTVAATNDLVAELPHTGTVLHAATSGDANYQGIAVGSVVANVTDNDVAGVVLSSATTTAAEGGATGSYTVRLASQPTADVTVALTDGAETNAAPASLTFTAANWNTAQTVTVTAVDDAIDEDDEVENVTHAATSTDGFYNIVLAGAVATTVSDNDTSAIVLSSTTAAVTEAGATDTYTVRLATQPSVDTTVTIVGGAQATATPSLTFTTANWATPQTVTVTAVNDAIDEAPNTQIITNTATAGDPRYTALTAMTVTASVTDNDTAGVVLTESGGGTTVVEAGATDTYTVVLTSEPTANVTVAMTHDGQVALSPASPLTFTPANWNTPQTVTVTAVNDIVAEGSLPSLITHAATSTDTAYVVPTVGTVNALVVDNDVDYLVVETTGSTAVNEAGATSDTVDVRLSTQPLNDVTVTVTTDAEVDASPATLTFTSANWATAQPVTITATDDDVDEASTENGVTTLTATSLDLNYNGLVRTVTATVADDDTVGVTITGTPAVAEAGATSDTYTVQLDSEPTAPVSIALAGSQVSVAGGPLLFNAGNWNTGQTVTVTALDDFIDEASPHTGSVSYVLSGGDYAALPVSPTSVDIADNDQAGYEIVASAGSSDVTEDAGTDTYDVRLTSEPTANVTVALAGTQVTVAPSPLTFTSATWNAWQTVTVTAGSDLVDEDTPHPGNVAHDATSTDLNYDALAIENHTVNVTDNDVAGVTITESGTTDVIEGTGTDTYTVVLDTMPTADVTITIADGTQLDALPTTLTFTTGNWNVAQTVTVSATDDFVAEGAHTGAITHAASSADPKYHTITINGVTANITDNDSAGVSVVHSGGTSEVTEGGTDDSFTVVLTSQPTADVTVTPAAGPGGDAATPTGALTFTSANWNVAQTVDVTAVNDLVDEASPEASSIVLDIASADSFYNVLADVPATVSVVDNDSAGVSVVHSGGTSEVTEGGTDDSFTVVLTSQPTADVTVTPAAGPGGDAATPTGALTFTSANWNVAQTVDVTAVNDLVDEASPEASSIVLDIASADSFYNVLADVPATVSVVDNDVRGLTIVQTGTTDVSEAGATDTYTVQLATEPTATVTVDLVGTQVNASTPLTFTTLDWNIAQTVTVAAVNDAYDEAAAHAGSVAYTVAGGDYAGLVVSPASVTVTDDDTAGFTLVEEAGSTAVNENGLTDTYTLALNSAPVNPVTISIASNNADLVRTPASLTFNDTNWNTPQTVTLSTPNDVAVEGLESGTLTHTATGDAQYAALPAPPSVTASIEDNDRAVMVSQPSLSVAEAGTTTASYTLKLSTRPSSNVTVAINVDAQVTRSAPSVLFTAADWNTPQTITITAVDDLIDEIDPHLSTVTHASTSSDLNYNALAIDSVATSVADNDTARLVVTESGTTDVTEGSGSDTYDVSLATQPTVDTTVTIAGGAQAGASPATLTFTTANWNTVQTVTVTAVNDAIDDDASNTQPITNTVTAGDPTYQALPASTVTANVTDNDTRGVTVDTSATTAIAELAATSTTYTVRLDSEPTGDVTIALTGAQVTAALSPLTFTSVNWATPQTVTVTAIEDQVDEADPHTGSVAHAISGGDYGSVTEPDVNVNIADNDTAGFTVAGSPSPVTEGGAGTSYTIRLDSQPTADVTVTVASSSDVTVNAMPLTFTAANWNTPQAVNVAAFDDLVDEDDDEMHAITHAVTSTDPAYSPLTIGDRTVEVDDNDTAGVMVTETPGVPTNTIVTEGGAPDTYTVVLATQPTTDVTVNITDDADVDVSSSSLTFTAANWATPQVVTVTATDDAFPEGPHSGTISHSVTSGDGKYSAITPNPVTALVFDNDGAVLITETGGTTDVDEGIGAPDTYSVVLTTEPTSDVTVTVTPDAQVSRAPATLTFTPANWFTPQFVTVDGVDDFVDEAAMHPGVISHTTASTDPSYAALTVASVTANVTDDDVTGVTVSPTTVSVNEAGATTDAYTVVLTSRPTSTVTFSPTVVGNDVTVSPATLVFAPGVWNTPQVVTVTAVNDDDDEAASHLDSITNDASSADTAYDTFVVPSVTANVSDDDAVGVTITESSGTTVTEGGTGDSYTVRLNSRPSANVTVTIGGDQTQATRGTSSLLFTPADWNTAQTVMVAAVNDAIDDTAGATFSHTVTSADLAYDLLGAVGSVAITVVDNDTAGVTVSKANVYVRESGTTDTYSVVLDSEPTANVTVNITDGAETNVSAPSLLFTPLNWSTAQTITVSAVDDAVAEGNHIEVITHSATSTDPLYVLTPALVSANIANNDPDIVASNAGPFTIAEGATSTYTVVLMSEPTDPVTVTPSSSDTDQVTVSGPLTFTGANWDVAQTVTITAVADQIDDGDLGATISHAVSSLDANYAVQTLASVSVTATDVDTRGVVLVGDSGLTVSEGASTSYTIRLATKPTANVTVTLTSSDWTELVDPVSVLFTPTDWNTLKPIMIDGVLDSPLDDGNVPVSITYSFAGGDYAGFVLAPTSVTVVDIDPV